MVNNLQHPFESCDKFEMLDQIFNKGPSPLPESLSPFIKQLIGNLLDKNPESRPDSNELMQLKEIQVYLKKILKQVLDTDLAMGTILND